MLINGFADTFGDIVLLRCTIRVESDLLLLHRPRDGSLREFSALEGQMPKIISDDAEAVVALAIVVASNEPLLFLTADQVVIAASNSFCSAFGVNPATVRGKRLSELGRGEWALPKLVRLLSATASGSVSIQAYEIELTVSNGVKRQLIINATRIEDGSTDRIRLLMAVTDVTDARADARHKDDLLREKAMLARELQHRVANSLQIIASILLQSARKVQSDEARGHLTSAHDRVMSIAAVQKQLSVFEGEKVALRTYLSQLCESLGISMLADSDAFSIITTVDDCYVEQDVSASLGLLVTELVINAIKHAFQEQFSGVIHVSYNADGSNWTLCVSDNGVGLPVGEDAPKAGLGTGIIEALAKNLMADVSVSDGNPGTVITIRHNSDTLMQDDLSSAL